MSKMQQYWKDLEDYFDMYERVSKNFTQNVTDILVELDPRFVKSKSHNGFFIVPKEGDHINQGIQCVPRRNGKMIALSVVASWNLGPDQTTYQFPFSMFAEDPVAHVMDCVKSATIRVEEVLKEVNASFQKLQHIKAAESAKTPSPAYYKVIDGEKYDRGLIELCDKIVSESSTGIITTYDAEDLYEMVVDAGRYTDIEKKTLNFIRENYRWTEDADVWFRTEVRKWAKTIS